MTIKEEKLPISSTNKIFVAIYMILYLIMPAILLLISLGFTDYPIQVSGLAGISRILFVLLSLPVYAVYASIILKALAQMASKWMLILLIPHIANLAWYAYNYQFSSDWLRIMIFDSIPMYVALNLCFFIGLLILIVMMSIYYTKEDGVLAVSGRALGTLVLVIAIFTPTVFFFIVGWNIAQTYNPDNLSVGIFKYLFSILLVILSHYRIIYDLWSKGKF
jgi:hypothetical protein